MLKDNTKSLIKDAAQYWFINKPSVPDNEDISWLSPVIAVSQYFSKEKVVRVPICCLWDLEEPTITPYKKIFMQLYVNECNSTIDHYKTFQRRLLEAWRAYFNRKRVLFRTLVKGNTYVYVGSGIILTENFKPLLVATIDIKNGTGYRRHFGSPDESMPSLRFENPSIYVSPLIDAPDFKMVRPYITDPFISSPFCVQISSLYSGMPISKTQTQLLNVNYRYMRSSDTFIIDIPRIKPTADVTEIIENIPSKIMLETIDQIL